MEEKERKIPIRTISPKPQSNQQRPAPSPSAPRPMPSVKRNLGFNTFLKTESRKKKQKTAKEKIIKTPLSYQPSANDSTKLNKILDLVIKWSIYAAVFLIPLFFLPITNSALESNKLLLLIILAGIGAVAWMGRMVSKNELQLKKSFLSVPILAFLLIYLLSSFFSIYGENSFWGYFGGEGSSWVALIFFVLLFYVISNNFSNKKAAYNLVFAFLASSFLTFILAALQLLGVKPFGLFKIEDVGFNTVGTVYSLATFAGSILVLAIAILTEKIDSNKTKVMAALAAAAAFLVVISVNFKLVWLILVLVMALLMVVGIIKNSKKRSSLFILPTVIFMISLFGFFIKKPIIPVEGLPTQILPSLKSTLQVGVASLKEKAFLGVGPNNFSYVFSKFQEPMGELSGTTFNQGVSYAATLFATGGIILTLSFLFLVVVMGRFAAINVYKTFFGNQTQDSSKISDQGEKIITPISLFWLFATIMLFLSLSSMSLLLGWWLALALLDALSPKSKHVTVSSGRSRVSLLAEKVGMRGLDANSNTLSRASLLISIMFVGIITAFIAVLYVASQKQLASYHYYKALVQAASAKDNDSLEKAGGSLNQAIYYNPKRDTYFSGLSDIYLALAQARIQEKGEEIGDEDRQYIWGAISGGVQAAEAAKTINPYNAKNYLKSAAIYQGIIGLVDGVEEPALENYQKALELDPTNPYIHNQIARIYLARYDQAITSYYEKEGKLPETIPNEAKENLNKAQKELEQSLALHAQNVPARLLLSGIYEIEGDLAKSIQVMQEAARISGDATNSLALSVLYYKDKQYDSAISLLEAIVKQWPDYSDARYLLGLTYAQKGSLDKSREQFQKVSSLNPDNEDVKTILNDLRAGNTRFLTRSSSNNAVEEVQQNIEENRQQEEQTEQTIMDETGPEPAAP